MFAIVPSPPAPSIAAIQNDIDPKSSTGYILLLRRPTIPESRSRTPSVIAAASRCRRITIPNKRPFRYRHCLDHMQYILAGTAWTGPMDQLWRE